MCVINLVPWREKKYQRNRRHFFYTLLSVTLAAVLLALIDYQRNVQIRIRYEASLADLQASLQQLEHDSDFALQTENVATIFIDQLHSKTRARMQQIEWQQQLQSWLQLATEARIVAVTWSGDEIVLRGVSELADPVRKLMHNSPDWQLQQIELNGQSRYQFQVSRVLQKEASL